MLVVAALLAFVIGISLGMLGAGGGILMVPLLVYVVGLETKRAIVTSLVIVGATSILAVVPHARAGRVQFKTAIVFGLAGMAGAFGGGRIAKLIPAPVLLLGLATMMMLSATAMLRGRREGERSMSLVKGAVVGSGAGFVSGMVGAGGGFLVVPALVVFGGLAMADAVGTSLVVIAMQCFAAVLGHIAHTSVDFGLAGLIGVSAIMGSLVGARASQHVTPAKLRLGFAWIVVSMAMLTVGKELARLGAPLPLVVAALVVQPSIVGLVWLRVRSANAAPNAAQNAAPNAERARVQSLQ